MSSFRQVETIYGVMTGFTDDLITKFLDRYGEWAPFETAIAKSIIQPGDIVLDAGAFVGTFSLSLKSSQPERIIAIEANPSTFEVLHHNATTLGADKIVALHGAIGVKLDENGAMPAQYFNEENRGSATFITDKTATPNTPNETFVQQLSLPEIRASYGDYNLAKVDLEGCELMALKADHAYLEAAKPFLIIEANDTVQTSQIANYCRSLGYETHYASLPVWRRHNPKNSSEPIFALAHEGALLACAPASLPEMPRELFSNGGSVVEVTDTTQLLEALWRTPRWSTDEWMEMSREQLIAVISRISEGDSRSDFQVRLYPTAPFGPDL